MSSQMRNYEARLGISFQLSKSIVNVPTGIPSLDAVLGNGFPLGSLVLIEEDQFGLYSQVISKCFLSEGIANNDSILIASKDNDPSIILNELPQAIAKTEYLSEACEEELKIAWRYQKNQQVFSAPTSFKNSVISHEFDFSSKLEERVISKLDVSTWPKCPADNINQLFLEISDFISSKKPNENESRKVIRVLLQSLGSPFWAVDQQFLYQFMFKLRTIVHNSFSVTVITISPQLLEPELIKKLKQLSDIVISLKSLNNVVDSHFNEYSGLINLQKISALNSITSYVPDDVDWAFKVKKKKLIIEKLHLPPENSITDQREQDELTDLPSCHLKF